MAELLRQGITTPDTRLGVLREYDNHDKGWWVILLRHNKWTRRTITYPLASWHRYNTTRAVHIVLPLLLQSSQWAQGTEGAETVALEEQVKDFQCLTFCFPQTFYQDLSLGHAALKLAESNTASKNVRRWADKFWLHCNWVKRKPTWCHLFYYFIQCSFNAQHVSAVNTTIFRSLRASDCIKTPHRHSHTETERQHTPNQIQPTK